jgi:hypothetical protein
MSTGLIRRLQERIRHEPTVDLAICPPIRPRPPVSEQALLSAMETIGFPLPQLIRELYTRVANGGYGPGYGVLPLGGPTYNLVASRLQMNEEAERDWAWPEQLVVLVNWGCHYFSGVDCSQKSCPVFFYNNDRNTEGATFADFLPPEADTLEEWLSAWLDGEDLWERGAKRRLHA